MGEEGSLNLTSQQTFSFPADLCSYLSLALSFSFVCSPRLFLSFFHMPAIKLDGFAHQSQGVIGLVENFVLLKCRKLRREDQETSDWIVSRISLFYDMCCYLQSSKISILSHFYRVSL